MMSWLRTAVALIGFSFAIVQYCNHLEDLADARTAYLPAAPKYLGLALITCGVLALVIAIAQYRWTVRYLWGETFIPIAGMEAAAEWLVQTTQKELADGTPPMASARRIVLTMA